MQLEAVERLARPRDDLGELRADRVGEGDVPDDAVFEQNNKPLTDLTVGDIIRLTSLVDKTPITIAVDRSWTNGRASPFWRLTFGQSKVSVAGQFEYIVLQEA